MLLKPASVSTNRFSYWHGMFVAEASDLPAFSRVWDDACDVGLTLVSARTGREIVCAVDHIERDLEGETRWWDLKPINYNERNLFNVRVYND